MPKRKWTEEEKKAFGEKMKKIREAKKVGSDEAIKPRQSTVVFPDMPVELDMTKDKNFNTEAEFVRWIHWEFDEGHTPSVIKITSHQALVIASFTKTVPVKGYNSPFGSHRIEIVPAKELEATNGKEKA